MLHPKGGGWHVSRAGSGTSRSIVTWPLRGQLITEQPWLHSPRGSERRAGFGNDFRTRTDSHG